MYKKRISKAKRSRLVGVARGGRCIMAADQGARAHQPDLRNAHDRRRVPSRRQGPRAAAIQIGRVAGEQIGAAPEARANGRYPERSDLVKHPKATLWGAGVMGVAGLVGAVLGPSPLVLPFVPLIAVAHVPFAVATAAMGIPSGLGEIGMVGKVVFVAWSVVLGAIAGRLLGAWRARRSSPTPQ